MRAVVKRAPGPGFEVVDDWPEPSAGPGQVLIQVAAASICGTDRELHEWTPSAAAYRVRTPVVMGHEGAGVVTVVGEGVTDLSVGDHVALESHLPDGTCYSCRTGAANCCPGTRLLGMHFDGLFAERVALPRELCVRLPAGIPLEIGALLESAGVGMHAVQRSGLAVAGQLVLVNGCGPIGLVLIRLAQAMGAARVVAVEPNEYRRGLAAELGAVAVAPAEDVVSLCRELAGARGGFDVAFEVSGAGGVHPGLIDCLRREAVLVTIAHPNGEVALDLGLTLNKKGITLRGIFGRRLWSTWERLLLMLDAGTLDLTTMVTHRLPLAEVEAAMALLAGRANKVLLIPSLG